MDHAYLRTVLDEYVLFDAEVILDILVEDQVLLNLFQEHLVLANIATNEGLLFQCDSVDCSSKTCADDKFRKQTYFPVGP